jgi:hypothetical protein
LPFFQFGENQFGNFAQGFKYALAGNGDAFGKGFAFHLELLGAFLDGKNPGKISLIVLQDLGNRIEVEFMYLEMIAQILSKRTVRAVWTKCG